MAQSDSIGNVNRRELLTAAGVGAAALVLEQGRAQAQSTKGRAIVFARTTIVTPDATHDDFALAVAGDRIAAIGPSDTILSQYPGAEIVDGRGRAILPGLVNCHAHMTATLERGFNEDFGFPNASHPAISPTRLLQGDEKTLMAQIAALEAIKSGTTSIVEFASGIGSYASALAQSGLRLVFAESVADTENVAGPMSAEGLAKSQPPHYSAQRRDEGMKRIGDLYSAWHGKAGGRISVFPTAALAETTSPDLLKAVRAFADQHDLGYSIHLSQSRPEVAFMVKHYGLSPVGFMARHGFLGPRLFAAHCRFVDQNDMALLGNSKTIISHQAAMAANRAVIPPIPDLRAAGCPIANGTDNNTNDMFEVMRIALVTERIARNKPDDPNPGQQPQPEDMLQDATLGGARALNQEKTIGALEVGRKADLMVINTLRPHLVPAGRILTAFIHNGQPSDIESVMVDGAFVMRDRKVLTMDEMALVAEADKVGRRIWTQVKAAGPLPISRLHT